jgi:hypothetical protein
VLELDARAADLPGAALVLGQCVEEPLGDDVLGGERLIGAETMSERQGESVSDVRIPTLDRIATTGQVWARVAAKCGVKDAAPPWKSSLDGLCDALDGEGEALPLLERRHEEDLLSEAVYSDLPAPEKQLVALAHSLVAKGVIQEDELARRMEAVRARLEAA